MASFLSKLDDELTGAVAEGLITADQARALNERAARRRPATRLRGVTAFGAVAGLLIAAGLSLIIAHNWDRIPDLLKIAVFLLMLGAAGEGARRVPTTAAGAPLDVVWFALPLLGIGLWAQIFQLSGDPVKPFLVWLALTLPLAWASERKVARVLHVAAMFVILFWGNFGTNSLLSIVTTRLWPSKVIISPDPLAWVLTAAVVAAIVTESPGLPPKLFVTSVGALLLWVVMLLVQRTPFYLSYEPAEILAWVSAPVLWVASTARLGVSDADRKLPRVAWFAGVYAMTFLWHAREFTPSEVNAAGLWLSLGLAAAAVGFAVLIPLDAFGRDARWRRFGQVMLVLPVLVTGLTFAGSETALKTAGLLANFIFLVAAVGIMAHGVKAGEPAQIDQGLLALLILVVTRFVDVFGSFVRSGLAFIALGVIMAAVAFALHRGRSKLRQLSEENRRA